MKLNIFSKAKEPDLPSMLSQQEIQAAHDLLAAIVMGQTAIKFTKLKRNELNPVQMVCEVLAYVLKHPNGRQVEAMIGHLRKQLEDFEAQQAEHQKALSIIEAGSTPPMIVGRNGK